MGLDLLPPVSGGVFLPGRLARLAACLMLTFALALTERGRALGRALDRACGRDRGRWAVAAAVTGLFFAWSLRVIVLSYMTNDDPFFLQAMAKIPEQGLSAVKNALPYTIAERTSSISMLLCIPIGLLYGLFPDGDWYLWYHLAVLLVSLTVIGRCVLVKTNTRRWPVWAGALIHGLLCAGVCLCAFAQISFTVTPAVAGAAAVALLLCRHHEARRAGRVLCDVLSAVLMLLCCLHRRATGYALLCFWALALAYQVLRDVLAGREGLKKRLGALALTAVVTLALIAGVFAAGPLQSDEDHQTAEHYRILIVDFLNDALTYDQYARAGVSQELATLIHGWYFMDKRITTELFKQVSDIYYADLAAQPAPSLPAQGLDIAARLAGYVAGDGQMLCRAGLLLALLALCLAAFIRFGWRYWPEMLCALCAAGGGAVLMLYLAKDGRFLLRVFLVVALPAIVTLLLTALSVPAEETVPAGVGRRRTAAGLGALCLCAAVACCAAGVYLTPHAADTASRADLFAGQWAIEDYARSVPDTTLVTNIYDNYSDPLHGPGEYPANRVLWGACGDLAKDPADRLYADDFFRDDVAFMTNNPAAVMYLLQYLSLDWGPVQATVQAQLGANIFVCRFEQIAPPAGQNGWYEQNGMTYYFRDGKALTGTQTIDGEQYTFSPAGVQAGFRSAPGAVGPTYLTNAYCLTTGA